MQLLITELPTTESPEGPVEVISLTWHDRCKARSRYQTDKGTDVALSLPRGTFLFDGTVLHNTKERTIVIKACPQPVLVISPATPQESCKVAHHLGNWHRSVEITDQGHLIAEFDSPLEDWLKQSGIKYATQTIPFQPNLRCSAHD